jgi:hypothetical protein
MLLPAILMISLAVISFTDILNAIDAKGIFIIGLLLLFPLLFLGQGMACGRGKGNIVLSLLVSTVTFVIIILIFLNSSALFYIVLYILVSLFGYGLARFTKRSTP